MPARCGRDSCYTYRIVRSSLSCGIRSSVWVCLGTCWPGGPSRRLAMSVSPSPYWRQTAKNARKPYGLCVRKRMCSCCMQGLGEELALCFASHGAKLILSARNRERLEVSATYCCCLPCAFVHPVCFAARQPGVSVPVWWSFTEPGSPRCRIQVVILTHNM